MKHVHLVGEVTERQCNAERMLAHGITARIRVERYDHLPPVALATSAESANS